MQLQEVVRQHWFLVRKTWKKRKSQLKTAERSFTEYAGSDEEITISVTPGKEETVEHFLWSAKKK